MKSYEVFKKFDRDGSGYVTSDDFVKHVQEGLRIKVDKDEILDLIRTVDVENKGYFDYIGFSKIFTT